jgi:acetyl esterase
MENQMKYAEGINKFVDRCNKAMPPNFYTLPIEQQRDMYLGLTKEFPYQIPPDVLVIDDTVPYEGRKLPIRVYRPKQTKGQGLLIYIRGGGFVVGSLESHNTVVAELCDKSGLVTIAPDFRMSPEHPFPAALEDCYGVLCGVVNDAQRLDIDPNRIVISGDSSGANMAVAVSMMSRDRGGPKLRGQTLISPVLDFTRWCQGGVDAPLLTGGEMEYYTACYVPEQELVKHPYVSPLVNGTFHGLPPAYIMAAEMDSLLVDSQEYARLLREEGTQVELVVEPGLVHSAVRARGLSPQVADAWERFIHHAALLACKEDLTNDN